MTSYHEYEAWLSFLDAQIQLEGEYVVCRFGPGLRVPLAECKQVEEIVYWARMLIDCIAEDERYIPIMYVTTAFTRFMKAKTGIEMNADEAAWEATVGYRRS